MVPDIGAVFCLVSLVLAVNCRVHHVDQRSLVIPGEEGIPSAAPDDLEDVPAGPSEYCLQLSDYLPVSPNRAVEALEIAINHPDEIVEAFPGGE